MDLLLCRSPSSVSVSAAQKSTQIRGRAGECLSCPGHGNQPHAHEPHAHIFINLVSPAGAAQHAGLRAGATRNKD
jgi:hypothetical protein